MHKKIGPDLLAPISPATLAGRHLFATNIPTNPATGEYVSADAYTQAKATFESLVAYVEAAGGNVSDIAQIMIYMIDKAHLPDMNKAWNEVFTTAPYPTRATVIVSDLVGPPDIKIEITANAVIGN